MQINEVEHQGQKLRCMMQEDKLYRILLDASQSIQIQAAANYLHKKHGLSICLSREMVNQWIRHTSKTPEPQRYPE